MKGRPDITKAIVKDYDSLVKGVKFTLTPNLAGTEMFVTAQFTALRPAVVPTQNRHVIEAWLSLTPAGEAIAADIAVLTFVTGSKIATIISGGAGGPGMFKAKLSPVCQLAINIAPVATIEYYLNALLPDGRIVTSPKIAITI